MFSVLILSSNFIRININIRLIEIAAIMYVFRRVYIVFKYLYMNDFVCVLHNSHDFIHVRIVSGKKFTNKTFEIDIRSFALCHLSRYILILY